MRPLQKYAILACALIGLALMPAGPALCDNLDFSFEDQTSADIDNLYVSPHSQSDWGDPVSGDAINSGDTSSVTMDDSAYGSECYFDFRIDFSGGTTSYLYNIDLCTATKIAVEADDSGQITYNVTYIAADQ